MDKEIISTEEACEILGVTRQTLYKLFEKKDIPGKKVGKRYKFFKKELVDYMKGKSGDTDYKEWELKGDFATEGIKKMARRTFQELASNIEELIANAYDADATIVDVIVDYDKMSLTITDDGNGMDEEALTSYVIYGESEKKNNYVSPKYHRSPIGEYGMGGKLAITNISSICKIVTRRNGKEHVFSMNRADLDKAKFVSDIKNKVLTKTCDLSAHGTLIYMDKLLSKKIDSERLLERFSAKMPKSQNFKILLITISQGERRTVEVEEPMFKYEEKFEFKESLKLIGDVSMIIYFTSDPIPATKQGIWTRVNGRTVNEKAEWFDLFRATSGTRYRYRLYGYGEADGLKDFVTFSKNDFIDCQEYREYWNFGHKSIVKVQNILLRRDEDTKKIGDRDTVKKVEKEINEIVSKLDDPLTLGNLEAKIKKEFTKNKEIAPDPAYPNFEEVEKQADKIATVVKRGKDKRERRNQSIAPSERMAFSGKNYTINTVDLSENGDLTKLVKDKNLIEINEKHPLFILASKEGSLAILIRDLAFTQISLDYSEGDTIIFENVLNELARIASDLHLNLNFTEEEPLITVN